MPLEIYYDDLTVEMQKKALEFYGYETPEDGNWDTEPLFVLEAEDEVEGNADNKP